MSPADKAKILAGLEHLFEIAVQNKKWFVMADWNVYFTPKELRECHKRGDFIFAHTYWELRDPPTPRDFAAEALEILESNKILRKRIAEGWNI